MRRAGLGEVRGGWGSWGRLLLAVLASGPAPTCTTSKTSTNLPQPPARYEPARDLGRLFHDVQLSGIFEDSKTFADARPRLDRKSTRLNSSHSQISYAVFCLKKKKAPIHTLRPDQ